MTPGYRGRLVLIAVLAIAGFLAARTAFADIEQQRQLFVDVYPEIERGNWQVVEDLSQDEQRLLSRYVLWPDLRAAFFRANLDEAGPDEVETFLGSYGLLRPARDLRYRYALHLAQKRDVDDFLAIYRQFYQGLGVAKLDCHALRAELVTGPDDKLVDRAMMLWMTGQSQDDACDPVFEHLAREGLIDRSAYIERFRLAVAAHEFTRARWLARSIDEDHVEIATRWIAARNRPAEFVANENHLPDDETTARQLAYAIERMTYADPVAALAAWRELGKARRFTAELAAETDRHIALWTARDGLRGAHGLLARLPASVADAEVLRWRARTSLRDGNWDDLIADIALMSTEERHAEQWRYWHGIALRETGATDTGNAMLETLSGERSYYGFLAADELGIPYALAHEDIPADDSIIGELAALESLIRARELFYVGLDSRGRSEWDDVIGTMPKERKLQAAKLANRWGWHSRAIATAASAGEFDDLSIRYPLPYREAFLAHSKAANIEPTWAYGVARSESLFMRDVRSSAGAIGLMQLMPTTGRRVARQLSLPYSGLDTLTNPDGNIRLGTSYLGEMTRRFGGNRLLATAAYNAGPLRVEEWLPESTEVDARIWIETIPFNETRRYVRRVMAAELIFHWRMTGELQRLKDTLPPVVAPAAKVASN